MGNLIERILTKSISKIEGNASQQQTKRILEYLKEEVAGELLANLRKDDIYIAPNKYAVVRRESAKLVKLDMNADFPALRLQLRWEELPERDQGYGYTFVCYYELVMPVSQYRSESKSLTIPMGCTFVGLESPVKDGILELPSCDGVDIKSDAQTLNIHAFVIYQELFACLFDPTRWKE